MMGLFSIVESGKGQKLIKELNRFGMRMNFQTTGLGTAPSELMDVFGLGSNDKDVIFSLGAECDVRSLIKGLNEIFQSHYKYGGLMIVLDIAAASRVLSEILNYQRNSIIESEAEEMQNENRNHLVVIAVNQGFSEDVMNCARKAGATGGTVIKGRLADVEQFAEFLNTTIDGEREMLFILTPAKISGQIMENVNRDFGLTSPANGIIFAMPTEKAFKI